MLAPYDALNTWYFEDAPGSTARGWRWSGAGRPSTRWCRTSTRDTALYEARRCLSCGGCIACDNCYAFCPDNAVIKLGPEGEYEVDLDYCKGCGLCVEECPTGSMLMVPEEV